MSCHSNGYPPELINLPTKGWYYDDRHPFKNGIAILNPLLGKHEDLLTNINICKHFISKKILLSDLLYDSNIDIDTLFAPDVHAIFLATKILSYGPTLKLNYTCPSCEMSSDTSVNLLSMTSSDVSYSFSTNNNIFYYSINDNEIQYKIITFEQESSLPDEYTWSDLIKKSIISINNITDINYINTFIDERLTIRENNEFKSIYNMTVPNINNKIILTCNSCGFKQKMPLQLNNFNVFGISSKDKKNIHDEIFTLSYYSEHGFSFNDVYNMPVALRKFYLNKLVDVKNKEKEKIDEASKSSSTPNKFKK